MTQQEPKKGKWQPGEVRENFTVNYSNGKKLTGTARAIGDPIYAIDVTEKDGNVRSFPVKNPDWQKS